MLFYKKGSNIDVCGHKLEILMDLCAIYFRCNERMESRMEEDNGSIFLRSERVKNICVCVCVIEGGRKTGLYNNSCDFLFF